MCHLKKTSYRHKSAILGSKDWSLGDMKIGLIVEGRSISLFYQFKGQKNSEGDLCGLGDRKGFVCDKGLPPWGFLCRFALSKVKRWKLKSLDAFFTFVKKLLRNN